MSLAHGSHLRRPFAGPADHDPGRAGVGVLDQIRPKVRAKMHQGCFVVGDAERQEPAPA